MHAPIVLYAYRPIRQRMHAPVGLYDTSAYACTYSPLRQAAQRETLQRSPHIRQRPPDVSIRQRMNVYKSAYMLCTHISAMKRAHLTTLYVSVCMYVLPVRSV